MLRIGLLGSIGSVNRNRNQCPTRNDGRRLTSRRRRKKASPFKTITLWILFLIFVLTATVFFVILLYLDLVTKEKNTKELAISCAAFSVSVLMAVRIWFSLPDDMEEASQNQHQVDRGHLNYGMPVGDLPIIDGSSVSSNLEMTPPHLSHLYMMPPHIDMTPPDFDMTPPAFSSHQQESPRTHLVRSSASKSPLPPSYSTLILNTSLSEEPPKYEDAVHHVV